MLNWPVRDPELKGDIKESMIEVINIIKDINAHMRYITEKVAEKNENK